MKAFFLSLALALACAANAFSESGDRVFPEKLKDKISIRIGSKCAIEFKRDGHRLLEPKKTGTPDGKSPFIEVKFEKTGSVIEERPMLMLTVQNHFPKVLRYRAAMRYKGRADYIETSIVPVFAGIMSGESWVDPIEELVLFDFKLTDEKF